MIIEMIPKPKDLQEMMTEKMIDETIIEILIEEMIIEMEAKKENPTTTTEETTEETTRELMTEITIETIEMRELATHQDIKKRERKTEEKEELPCNGLRLRKSLLEILNSISSSRYIFNKFR
jgi:hypothetical protein